MPRLARGVVRVLDDHRRLAEPPREGDEPIVALMRPQGGVASVPQLHEVLGPKAFASMRRARRLHQIYWEVYGLSPILPEHGWRNAACLAAGDGAATSFRSAGRLWGFDIDPPPQPEVTVPAGGGRDVKGITIHRTRGFAPGDLVVVGGCPATSPARTFVDLGLVLRPDELRQAMRAAQYLKVIGPGDLEAAIAAHPGHRGIKALKIADPELSRRADLESPLEDDLMEILARAGLPVPEVQQWVKGISGTSYRVDGLYRAEGILIEADGRRAHARALAFDDDRYRDTDLLAVNLLTFRFTWTQIHHTPEIIPPRVRAALELRRRGSA